MMKSDAIFKAHCKTFAVAKAITGKGNVSSFEEVTGAPYCLRIVSKHRTAVISAFRDTVAQEVRKQRR